MATDLDNESSLERARKRVAGGHGNFSLLLGFDYADLDENDRAQKSIFDPDPDPRRLTAELSRNLLMSTSEISSATLKWDLDGVRIENIARLPASGERPFLRCGID